MDLAPQCATHPPGDPSCSLAFLTHPLAFADKMRTPTAAQCTRALAQQPLLESRGIAPYAKTTYLLSPTSKALLKDMQTDLLHRKAMESFPGDPLSQDVAKEIAKRIQSAGNVFSSLVFPGDPSGAMQ